MTRAEGRGEVRERPTGPPSSEPGGKELSITGGQVSDEHVHVNRHKEKIRWRSTDKEYKLVFNAPPEDDRGNPWPFRESRGTIVVPASGRTGYYTIRSDAKTLKGYGYSVNPQPPEKPTPEVIPDP